MPTIAFVMQSFYGDAIGGAERQVQMLAEALRGVGWRTFYIAERAADKPRRETVNGMQVLALPQRKKRTSILNYGPLMSAMRESGADLFYQRIRHPYTGLTGQIAKKLGKPFVWAAASLADTIRDRDLRQSESAAFLDRILHPLNRFLEDRGIFRADAIILQTHEQQERLEKNYGRRGTVIPNHIIVNPNLNVAKAQPPAVLWLSNIKPFKRADLFIALAEKCADLEAAFIMAGLCPNPSMRRMIEEAQARLPQFKYLGPLEPAEAESEIAAASLLVNTSLFEGFPNAFQQAWYYGVPTLSLGVDPDGVIEHEGLGKCCADLDELESHLRRLLKDPQSLVEIGRRARDFATANYDLQNLLPKYLEIFNNLLRP
ncbi:MAG TPA: glycosyltransferase family 4 protein [bacterium]|jgi:glycosyltransferase involved in cell wall biosynthesis